MKFMRFISILLAVSAMLFIPSCEDELASSQIDGGGGIMRHLLTLI